MVRPGGNAHRETPPETGVAVFAVHPGEAGAGMTPVADLKELVNSILSLLLVFCSGAAQRAGGQKPGQRRLVLGPAGRLPGLGSEPAGKISPHYDLGNVQ